MNRKFNYSAVLCLLVFGSCNAGWMIEDQWTDTAEPLSKDEIQKKAEEWNRSIESIRQSAAGLQKQIDSYQNIITQSEKQMASYQQEITQIDKRLANMNQNSWAEFSERMNLQGQRMRVAGLASGVQMTINAYQNTISGLQNNIKGLQQMEQNMKQQVAAKKQKELEDRDKGIVRRAEITIQQDGISMTKLKVPHGGSTLIATNKDSDDLDYASSNTASTSSISIFVKNEPNTLFPLQTRFMRGTSSSVVSNNNEIRTTIAPGTKIIISDRGDGLYNESRYLIIADNTVTKKKWARFAPDGTINEIHETIDEIQDNVFSETYKIYYPKKQGEEKVVSKQSVNLNDSQTKVVLKKPCLNSFVIKKMEGDKVVSEKTLVCERS